ncbi:MAG TPA: beta-propeller fold lactonase family protein [Acidimicrobiia bacterium]|nr:beta-propeller fold lactonase family protein [Acidimicrobiia bacterium]
MPLFTRAFACLLAAVASFAVLGGAAAAAPEPGSVYVLSNQVAGNSVLEYARAADGRLTFVAAHATGGVGTGGGLGSQGAVIVDRPGRYVYAVNAGSNSVTSFRVTAGGLERVDIVGSQGIRPTSVTVRDGVLYVLNAGGDGNIAGFTTTNGDLEPIAGSARPLSSNAAAAAQVSFTPDGDQLIVAERATNALSLYRVGADGLATGPTTVASSGVTPFGFDFDNKGHVLVSEAFGGAADASAASSYTIGDGALDLVSGSVPTTETAACWLVVSNDGRFAYTGNAGTASITGYAVGTDGSLTILDADGKTASAPAGVTDLALSVNSKFLYARMGNGTIGSYRVGSDGSLSDLGAAPGLPAGAAGIAAR